LAHFFGRDAANLTRFWINVQIIGA
jgi:hypothetical protein